METRECDEALWLQESKKAPRLPVLWVRRSVHPHLRAVQGKWNRWACDPWHRTSNVQNPQREGRQKVKKADVKVGGVYTAKVSGRIVSVRLQSESPYGGWNAINLQTQRGIRIKSAARLRAPAKPKRCGQCEACLRVAAHQPAVAKELRDAVQKGDEQWQRAVAITWNTFCNNNSCKAV